MHAVIRTGGKQYRVTAGDILEIEKLDGNVGDSLELDDVLLVSNGDMVKIGQPTVEGATVQARITGQHRAKKILVFRYRPKKRIRVRRGHRQYLTRIEINGVTVDGVVYDSPPVVAEPIVEETVAEEVIAAAPAATESVFEETSVIEETPVVDEVVDSAATEVADEVEAAVEEVETVAEEAVTEEVEEATSDDSAESTDDESSEEE